MKTINKSYTELILLKTFEERYNYLKTNQSIGSETFGSSRHINQNFYRSSRWKHARDVVILRDHSGNDVCDLGVEGYPIVGLIYVHHINPITIDDILNDREWLYSPEFLISTSFDTHEGIHFGSNAPLHIVKDYVCRAKNDTCPWKK